MLGETLSRLRGEMTVHLPMLQSDHISIFLEENDHA